jgi:hypothetical protein
LPSRFFWVCTLLVSTFVLYQNCGEPLHNNVTSSGVLFSGSCEAPIMNAFSTHYYTVFKAKCATCHSTGPGLGAFANPDFQTAFNGFNSLGRTRVERNFLSPAHQAGITGSQNQPFVDRAAADWLKAEAEFKECAKTSGDLTGTEFKTLHKANATIVTRATMANPWVRLEWDLENETANPADKGKYLMIASIEVRVALSAGNFMGYEFRNPTLRLKAAASKGYRFEKLHISINDLIVNDLTTYSQISGLILATTDVNLAPGAGFALALHSPVINTDSFALAFDKIEVDNGMTNGGTTGGGTTGGTSGGTMPLPLPTSVTFTQLTSTDTSVNVFRRACLNCHNAGNMSGGLDLSNYTASRNAVAEIVSRMNNAGNPMPRSGLLSDRDRELVRIWQNGGTAQ